MTGLFEKKENSREAKILTQRAESYKKDYRQNEIIQFKNERIAILAKSRPQQQVELIVAFDDLTKEGYRLMAIDEGVNMASKNFVVFYFQKLG